MRKSSSAGVSSQLVSVSFFYFFYQSRSYGLKISCNRSWWSALRNHSQPLFLSEAFQTRLQRALFDFRAALIYIIRFLASISRPVVYYASNARLGAGATRFFSTIVRRGVLRTFGDNHLTLT